MKVLFEINKFYIAVFVNKECAKKYIE